MLEELLENPEKFRLGENYRASNIVFPVEFKGERYIAKKPRTLGTVIQGYYAFVDSLGQGTRKFCTGREALQEEVRKLEKLGGLHAPVLCSYREGLIIREYIDGKLFLELPESEQSPAILAVLRSMRDMHNKGVVLGDAHLKNVLFNEDVIWVDMDGVFDEKDVEKAQALDYFKFIYSVYNVTKDEILAIRAAVWLATFFSEEKIKEILKESSYDGDAIASLRLEIAHRLPPGDQLTEYLKNKFGSNF